MHVNSSEYITVHNKSPEKLQFIHVVSGSVWACAPRLLLSVLFCLELMCVNWHLPPFDFLSVVLFSFLHLLRLPEKLNSTSCMAEYLSRESPNSFHNLCVDREQQNGHWFIWKCHCYLNVSISLVVDGIKSGMTAMIKDGRGNDLPNKSVNLTMFKLHAPQTHWGTKTLMYCMSSIFYLPATPPPLLFHSCSLDSYIVDFWALLSSCSFL